MAPGHVELPNPFKLFQNMAFHLQNRNKTRQHTDDPTSEGEKLAEEDTPKLAVYAAATEPALTSPGPSIPQYQVPAGPITKEDLGRATWTLLHTLAAQYPENPTRRQQKDVKALVMRPRACTLHTLPEKMRSMLSGCGSTQVELMTRIYPCSDCAEHFGDLVRWADDLCADTAHQSAHHPDKGRPSAGGIPRK